MLMSCGGGGGQGFPLCELVWNPGRARSPHCLGWAAQGGRKDTEGPQAFFQSPPNVATGPAGRTVVKCPEPPRMDPAVTQPVVLRSLL